MGVIPADYKTANAILDELRGTGADFEKYDLDGFLAAFEADQSTAFQVLRALNLIARNFFFRNEPAGRAALILSKILRRLVMTSARHSANRSAQSPPWRRKRLP